eukprot:GCRY01001276.1.p1 GENE.GCRY01001276.1~~GCRY01001276.1.p1  ORF type:complete len:567 (-),score=200.96 GCRY01001276.1:149-1849(-)
MLKPMLARGELRCLGATTTDEYRKHIEKDPALARRFQPVFVGEPSVADTITLLRGIKPKYEVYHGVTVKDEALVSAATMADRYITERHLPDKAIDLVDEAMARVKLQQQSRPDEIEALDREVLVLDIEKNALQKEKDPGAEARKAEIGRLLQQKKVQLAELERKWREEKTRLETIQTLRTELDARRTELERVTRTGGLDRAAELQYSVIPRLEQNIVDETAKTKQTDQSVLHTVVDAQDIAKVVAMSTGIPVNDLLEGERAKILHMEHSIRERIVGQDPAVEAISNAIRRARAGITAPHRPLGSFLFLGPTGVGKTALCKALSQFLFNTEAALLRIDMSEYMERFSVSRLIGAPPGYVGYEEGGTLTEAVRRRPYQVILLDEFEKAHREVSNLLLQVLDDGILTDSQGHRVNFENTVVVMTSNLGADILAGLGPETPAASVRDQIMARVRGHFSPEFVNRLDDIILFNKLSRSDIARVVGIQLAELKALLLSRDIHLSFTDELEEHIADKGFDPVYGARPLKRVIQSELLNRLASQLLEGSIKKGDHVQFATDTNKDVLFKVLSED